MINASLIGPIGEGIRTDTKPWTSPKDSFETMTNMYQWRGRLVRKPGYSLLGQLANGTPVMGLKTQEQFAIGVQTLIAFDLTTAYSFNGTAFVVLPSVMPVTWSGTNYQFFQTTNYAGAFWATNGKAGLNGFNVSNAVAGVGITTITTTLPNGFTTGDSVSLINLGGMDDINGRTFIIIVTGPNTFTIPFQSTGTYTTGGMALNPEVTVANQDGIRYYGVLETGTGWANYNPPINTTTALAGALFIFPYRGYLVFLNTQEGNENGVFTFQNRARWTQIGTPYYAHPVPTLPNLQTVEEDAVRDDLFGKGGAFDAPTNEAIVSAGFIRDILVVYFERSTWRLRFVNNSQNPFVWERVNVELGSSCPSSAIVFDKGLMAISNRGIVISDGNDSQRFDEKIPEDIFNIRESENGLLRVHGIRTFRTKLNFWTYPSADNPLGIYPDKVLVFNYETTTWAYFDDCFTCFGYYYEAGGGFTWGELPDAWSSYTNINWNSGISQTGYENVVAGNQQGYVFVLELPGPRNDPSLTVLAFTAASPGVITSTDHNLPIDTWIKLTGVTGITSDDGVSLNDRNFKISVIDKDNFSLNEFAPINGGNAVGASYTYTISYSNIIIGSAQINIGTLVFTDPNADGNLVSLGGSGTIDYATGEINLTFTPPILSTAVFIRVVTLDPLQDLDAVNTIGVYAGGGQITKISGIDVQTKIFNFLELDKRARLSRIDFYVNSTKSGQFTANIFADSSDSVINEPLADNLESNVVLTSPNPYQISKGDETIFRLYADCLAQTVQLQMTLSDAQLAVDAISESDIEILAMNFKLRAGGRLV